MANRRNPAKELRDVLAQMDAASKPPASGEQGPAVLRIWEQVLGQNPMARDNIDFLARLAGVYILPLLILRRINELNDVDKPFLREKLRDAVKVLTATARQWDARPIMGYNAVNEDREALSYIGSAIHDLDILVNILSVANTGNAVNPVSKARLQGVYSEVESLKAEVVSARIRPEFRAFLLHHVGAMESAILEVDARGLEGLRDVLQGVVGAVVINQNGDNRPQTDEERSLRERLMVGVASALTVVSLINGVLELPKHAYEATTYVQELGPGQAQPRPGQEDADRDSDADD